MDLGRLIFARNVSMLTVRLGITFCIHDQMEKARAINNDGARNRAHKAYLILMTLKYIWISRRSDAIVQKPMENVCINLLLSTDPSMVVISIFLSSGNPRVFASKICCPCGVLKWKFAVIGLAVYRDNGSWFGTAAALLLLLSAMLFSGTLFGTLFKFWRRPVGGSKGGQRSGWRFWVFDRNNLTWNIESQRIVEVDACNEQMNSKCNVRKFPEQLILSILKRELLVKTSTAQDGMKFIASNQKEWNLSFATKLTWRQRRWSLQLLQFSPSQNYDLI